MLVLDDEDGEDARDEAGQFAVLLLLLEDEMVDALSLLASSSSSSSSSSASTLCHGGCTTGESGCRGWCAGAKGSSLREKDEVSGEAEEEAICS